MPGYLFRSCVLPAVAAALAACSSGPPKETEPNIPPANYKQEILLTLTRTLDDPTNLRDAGITEPALTKVGAEQRYALCVRLNARDASHVYMGPKHYVVYFFGGAVNQLVEAEAGQCANAAYKPFPEAEKLCFANKCG
jgi:hypothetical protein